MLPKRRSIPTIGWHINVCLTLGKAAGKPGASVDMPAVLAPMPAGSYTLELDSATILADFPGQRMEVVIKDNPQLLREREQGIRKKVLEGERFAWHVAGAYPTKGLVEMLLEDLLADDAQRALRATYPLQHLPRLPRESTALLTRAMKKHLALEAEQRSSRLGVLGSLSWLAALVGTDEALEPVLSLAHSQLYAETRASAVVALGRFKQARATHELRGFLQDKEDVVRFRAAQTLAERKDQAALAVLLDVATDPQTRWRDYAFEALAKFPEDPRVEPALKKAAESEQPPHGGPATRALGALEDARRAREKRKPDYRPLKPGMEWQFRVGADGREGHFSARITAIENVAGQSLAREELLARGRVVGTQYLSSNAQGVFRHRFDDLQFTPPVCLLKYPVKAGDSWEIDTKIGDEKAHVTCSVGKEEELEVPAGKYKAIPVTMQEQHGAKKLMRTYWYADGVGPVKFAWEWEGKKRTCLLEKFKAGK